MHGLGKLALWAAALLPFAAGAPLAGEQAEKPAVASDKLVPNKYIVSLKPGIQPRDHLAWVEDVHKRSVGKRDGLTTGVGKTMSIDGTDFMTYSGSFDEATIESIKQNSDVRILFFLFFLFFFSFFIIYIVTNYFPPPGS